MSYKCIPKQNKQVHIRQKRKHNISHHFLSHALTLPALHEYIKLNTSSENTTNPTLKQTNSSHTTSTPSISSKHKYKKLPKSPTLPQLHHLKPPLESQHRDNCYINVKIELTNKKRVQTNKKVSHLLTAIPTHLKPHHLSPSPSSKPKYEPEPSPLQKIKDRTHSLTSPGEVRCSF